MVASFDVEIADAVAHIRLNRPEKHNALTAEFWTDLPRTVRDIDNNAKARVIVLSSAGANFCSGMDTSLFPPTEPQSFESAPMRAEAFRRHLLHLQDSLSALEQSRLSILAAVQGACIGGGVDMISACDMRYATHDAVFCIQEINLAIVADVGTFPRLCKLIPEGWVRELSYTGCRLPAAKAKEIGLVNEIYADHTAMLSAVLEKAREIATKSPLAIAGSKVMINYSRDHSVRDALDYVATWQAGMFAPTQVAESFSARREKRLARYPELEILKDAP